MAFSSILARGFTAETAADTAITHTPTVTVPAGRIAVVVVATKNVATTDGATATHSVADSVGNTWTKVGEYTETAAGAADDGATISLHVSKLETELVATTDTVTATLTGSIGDKLIGLLEVTSSAGYGVGLAQLGVGQGAMEAAVTGMPSRSYWLVGAAAAVGSDNAKTPDADYAEFIDQRSRNNAAAIAIHVQARIATLTADTVTSTAWTGTQPIALLAAFYEALGCVTATIASTAVLTAPTVAGEGGADQDLTSATIASGATLTAPTVAAVVSTFYVSPSGSDANPGTEGSPFLTIGAARTAVQAQTSGMTGNITVYLRGGTYTLTATETFTPADSGQNGFAVIWRNYPGETPRISGGQTITGWSDQGGGLWRASTSLTFRQFYVNDVRAIRARYPKTGSYGEVVFWNTDADEIELEAGHADEAANAQELVVYGHGVNGSILRIASVSGAVVVPQTTEQGRLFLQTYPPKGPGNTYYLQGGLNLCTAAGEWHLDTAGDFLYYRPRAGEDMATAVARVPQVERLISLIGTNGSTTIHDLQFYGLTFEQAAWSLPDSEGFVGDQGPTYFLTTLGADQITSYPSGRMACAVYVYDADDIRFERCLWRNCGADGLHFYRGVRDSQIIGNVFYDLAGGCAAVDLALLGNTGTSTIPCRRITITNNYCTRFGLEFVQSYGLMCGYVDEPIVDHNELFEAPYIGIGLGWGWSYESNTMASALVRRNEVWNTCQLMRDSAAIYTLSDQNGGLIEHNYVHDITRNANTSGGFNISDIYLDQGSGDLTVQNNVCTIQADTAVFQNANGSNVSLSNNDASDPGGVITNAGLEAAYEDIRDLVPSGGPQSLTGAVLATGAAVYGVTAGIEQGISLP